MHWKIHEIADDADGLKSWSLYIISDGDHRPPLEAVPIAKGYWFFTKENGDPAGKRFLEQGWQKASRELDRLNRLGMPPGDYPVAVENSNGEASETPVRDLQFSASLPRNSS